MGKKSATVTSSTSPNPEAMKYYTDALAAGKLAASQPYQAWGTTASDYVAQINPQQQAGITGINQAAGSYQPYLNAATGATTGAMGGLSSADIERYMSPYLSNVAGTTADLMNQASQQAQSSALGSAASSGAFGGDRAGIAAANLHQQQQLALGNTLANILNQGYGQALSTAQQQQGVQMQGAQQLAGLGQMAQGLGLAGANAQIGAGTLQQQTEQAGIDALMNNFMQSKAFPYQNAQYLTGLASALGPLMGTTSAETHPTNLFGNVKLATGGRVERASGGLAGGQFSHGYVPEVALSPAQPDTPQISTTGGKSALGETMGIASKIFSFGRADGGRIGYDNGGGAAGGQPEDEARLAAAKAAAEASLRPKPGLAPAAPQYKEYPVGGDMWHKGPQGTIADAYGNPVDIDRAETVRNAIASQEMLQGGQRLAQSDLMAQQFRQSRDDAANALAQRNRDALAGMYEGNFPVSGLAAASMNHPGGGPGTFPPAGMPASLSGPLAHPVNPDAEFKANLGAAYSNMGSAEAAQERAGRAGMPAPARPAGLGAPAAQPMPVPAAQSQPAPAVQPGLNAPAAPTGGIDPREFYRTRIIQQESGGRQFDQNGNPLTSPAGAVGVGQVMEATGPEAARLAGLEWDRNRWLNDPQYNAAIGEAYFVDQFRKFGSLDKAAAAYNAGPGAVASAIDRATALGGSWSDYLPGETQNYIASTTGSGAAPAGRQEGLTPAGGLGGLGAATTPGTSRGDVLLSILGGLGAAAQSKGNLLGILASGAGGYADTRSALARQASDIAMQEAQAQRERLTGAREAYTTIPGYGPARVNADGSISPVEAGATSAIPYAGSADLSGTVFNTPAAKDAFGVSGNLKRTVDWQTLAAQSGEMLMSAQNDASNAYGGMASTNEQARSVYNLNNSSIGQPGTFSTPRDAVVKTINTVLRIVDPSAEGVSMSDTDNAILGKVANAKSAMMAAGFDQNSFDAMAALASGLPSGNLPSGANSVIMSSLFSAQQRAIDRARFINDFVSVNPNGRLAQGADTLFDSTMAQKYNKERELLVNLFNSKVPPDASGRTIIDYLTSGELSAADTQNLLKYALGDEVPADMYRYFTPFTSGGQ